MKNFKKYKIGMLAVSLLLTLFFGCKDEETFAPINPKASFTYKVSTEDFYQIKFTSVVRDRDSLRWDFGDGETSTLAHPLHTYAEVGTYAVSLTAYGESGSTPTVIDTTVSIVLIDPTVVFSATASTSDPLEVTFKATTTYAKSYAWDFGDGETSTEKNPTHVFPVKGTYPITVTVTGFDETTPAVLTQNLEIGVVLEKLNGTIIGHASSWGDDPTHYVAAAFDGDLATFVDAPSESASTGFVGYDFGEGSQVVIKLVKYAPREGQEARMVNAEIRGSNDPTILTDPANAAYDILYTITEEPTFGEFATATISTTESYRFVYYYTAPNGYCNISELEFWAEKP